LPPPQFIVINIQSGQVFGGQWSPIRHTQLYHVGELAENIWADTVDHCS